MKKFIAVFILLIMVLVTAGCGEAGSEAQAENQPVVLEYKDIDPETIQLLESYMQKINLILELGWNGSYADELRYEKEEFKKVLEILYEDKTGQPFPQENDIARLDTYLDTADWFFRLDRGYLCRMLSVYEYDFATDTVTTAGDIDTDAILTIRDIRCTDGIYEIEFNRKYEEYDRKTDSYKLGNITQGTLKVELGDDGSCRFVSNNINRTEYTWIYGVDYETYMRLRTYAMGDVLNYSWNEQDNGSLFVDDNYKAIQYSVEKMYRLYNNKDFNHNDGDGLYRYTRYANKFFDFDKEYIYKTLGITDAAEDLVPLCDYVTDDNHYILFTGMRTDGDYVYVDYINGIRNFDSRTGRYQLLDAVESTLVYKYFKDTERHKAVANINAYYDVKDKERYEKYLQLLTPALEINWDESTQNALTSNPQAMKAALQNIYIKDNIIKDSDEQDYSAQSYRYAAEKFFVFGKQGFDAMLKNDASYDSINDTLKPALNDGIDADLSITDIEYQDGYRVISYKKGDKLGKLTVKRYPEGTEKVASNSFDTRRLTLQELEQINKYYRNTPRWQYVLKNLFESPEKINITDVFRSMPTESRLTYDCYYEVHMRKKNGVELDYDRLERGLEEYGRVSAQSVDRVLKETMNISLSQVENPYVDYSPEYSCYYKSKEYSAYPSCQFIDGYIVGDTVMVYDDYWCLTLKKTDDKYYIYSFTRNEEKHTTDIYAENGISTEIQLFTRDVYLEQEPGKSATYNNAINAYNDFLSGKISVNDEKYDPDFWVGNSGGYGPVSSYGVMDLNKDNIPELIVYNRSFMYDVYSYKNGSIIQWNVPFYGGMNGPDAIFTDGMVASGHISTGAWYDFYRFNADGSSTNIMSFDWYEPQNHFKFNGRMVTKEEFERLTDPWLDKFDNPADIDMKSYLLKKEYWEIYADKLA